MKFPILFGAGAAILLTLAGCKSGASGGSTSSAVATVGKDSITEKEFFDYLQRKPAFAAIVQGQNVSVAVADTPGFQALKDLIINKVILQLATEQGNYPDDKKVNDELDFQRQQAPKLIDTALARGLSLDDIKSEIRLELAKYNLQTKGVTETTADATAYMDSHPKEFMDPPMIQAQVIFAKKADEPKVDQALAGGAPFSTVAKQYTLDPNGKYGEKADFRYDIVNELQMPKNIRALLDATGELKTTEWKPLDKAGTAGFKFYVLKKIGSKAMVRTPNLIERVRRALALQKGQRDRKIDLNKLIASRIQAMKDTVKIDLKQDQLAWSTFVSNLTAELAKINGAGAGVLGTPPAAGGSPPPIGAPPAVGGAAAPKSGKK